jgi:hypothetical protein
VAGAGAVDVDEYVSVDLCLRAWMGTSCMWLQVTTYAVSLYFGS